MRRLAVTIGLVFVSTFARAMDQVPCSAGAFFYHADPDVIDAKLKRSIFNCRGDAKTLVGMDPGTDAQDLRESDDRVRKVIKLGCPYHIYFPGVVGPTGGVWGDYERTLCSQRNCLSSSWRKTGWWTRTQAEILRYKKKFPKNQPYSLEIDNLSRATSIGESGEGFGSFLEKFCRWRIENGVTTKIVLKNLSKAQMKKTAAMIRSPQVGHLYGNCVAEFAISEYGTDNINKEAGALGINVYRAGSFGETFNYRASVRNARSCAKPEDRSVASEPARP